MAIIFTYVHKLFSIVGPFFILLGLLIFIHELGHFLVAKFFKVRVEVFSLGFGKKLLKFVRGETTYCLSLIPLGGYVKMYGDDPSAEIPESEKPHAFLYKPVAQRIAVVVAGPLMNLFFAWFLFSVIAVVGEQVAPAVVGDVAQDSIAYQAGFRSGDRILEVGGTHTKYWDDVKNSVEHAAGQVLKITVRGEGSTTERTLDAPVTLADNDNVFSSDRQVGSVPGLQLTSKAPLVGVPNPQSLASAAGLHSNDIILEINGKKVEFLRLLGATLAEAWPSDNLKIVIRSYDIKNDNPADKTLELKGYLAKVKSVTAENALEKFGIEDSDRYLLAVKPKSPAARAGLQKGDKIIALDKKPVPTWDEVLNRVKNFQPTEAAIEFEVLRDGKTISAAITPELTDLMNEKHQSESRYTVGIVPSIASTISEPTFRRYHDLGDIFRYGIKETYNWTNMVVMSLVGSFKMKSPKNIAGVITIGRVASSTYELGLSPFLKIMAIISINLFLLNMLPIPILDGGHLVFFTIEALRGAPLSLRKMEIAQQVGMVLLMLVMVFAFFNDITNLFDSSW